MDFKEYVIVLCGLMVFLIIILTQLLVIQNQNLNLVNLTAQIESYKNLDSMKNAPMPVNGDGGRFLPEQNLLYVRTDWSNQQTCLFFLHEWFHSQQWKANNKCFYDVNSMACEMEAEQFSNQNKWRCD